MGGGASQMHMLHSVAGGAASHISPHLAQRFSGDAAASLLGNNPMLQQSQHQPQLASQTVPQLIERRERVTARKNDLSNHINQLQAMMRSAPTNPGGMDNLQELHNKHKQELDKVISMEHLITQQIQMHIAAGVPK